MQVPVVVSVVAGGNGCAVVSEGGGWRWRLMLVMQL